MNQLKKTAIIVGTLFILATVFSLVSTALTGPVTGATNPLAVAAAHQNQIIIGALFLIGAALSIILIPLAFYPVLKRKSQSIAAGYVGIRTIEAVILVIDAIVLLLLVTAGQQYTNLANQNLSYLQTFVTMLLGANNWLFILDPVVFGLSAVMLNYLLYRFKLIPQWLSAWGLIGAILVWAMGFLGMFGSLPTLLAVPIGIQEMAMAAWLVVKGFTPSTLASTDQAIKDS